MIAAGYVEGGNAGLVKKLKVSASIANAGVYIIGGAGAVAG